MYSKKGIPLVKIAQSKTTYKRNIPMNYFTTSLMKNLFTNDNNLPLFEQAVTVTHSANADSMATSFLFIKNLLKFYSS